MKLELPQGWRVNLRDFLRRCGYASIIDHRSGRLSFTRRLTSDYYPRFHIYIEKNLTGKNFLNLHLDQKQPSYPDSPAHQGLYDGPIIEDEILSLKKKLYETLEFTSFAEAPQPDSLIQRFLNKFF